jgi:hypothetical protein
MRESTEKRRERNEETKKIKVVEKYEAIDKVT